MKKLLCSILVFISLNAIAEEKMSAETIASAVNAKAENEIPVHLEAVKKSGDNDSPVMRMLSGLGIVALLGLGSILYIKKLKKGKDLKESAPDIRVLTQHHLGPKKSLAIIRVAGESILIGVTDQNISLIKELSLLDEDIPTELPKKFALKEENIDDEEFSISGIKDVVTTRLKNMRSFQ